MFLCCPTSGTKINPTTTEIKIKKRKPPNNCIIIKITKTTIEKRGNKKKEDSKTSPSQLNQKLRKNKIHIFNSTHLRKHHRINEKIKAYKHPRPRNEHDALPKQGCSILFIARCQEPSAAGQQSLIDESPLLHQRIYPRQETLPPQARRTALK